MTIIIILGSLSQDVKSGHNNACLTLFIVSRISGHYEISTSTTRSHPHGLNMLRAFRENIKSGPTRSESGVVPQNDPDGVGDVMRDNGYWMSLIDTSVVLHCRPTSGVRSTNHNQSTLVAATTTNGGTTRTPWLYHLSLVGERSCRPNTSLGMGVAAHDTPPSNYRLGVQAQTEL